MDLSRLTIVEIFNAQGSTRELAKIYCLSTSTISKIKGGTYPYDLVIADYKRQNLTRLITGGFGYDKHYKQFEKFVLDGKSF